MNLLTPIAGFLIGYGGIMGYQVIDSTYKGEMPGPKYFGYFIGAMTLLSAGTIYALGRTDKVFNADGNYNDFIEDMEGVMGKYGEMKDFDSGYNPQDNLLNARMVVEVDDDDFDNVEFDAEMPIYDINWDTDGEIIPEDGEGNELPSTVMVPSDLEEDEIADYLSDKYGWLVLGFVKGQKYRSEEDERVVCFICNLTPEESDGEHGPMMSTLGGDACKDCAEEYGYRHPRDMIYLDAEMMMPEKQCVICGGPYTGYGHNPEPIFPMSHGRCCDTCNATVVIPYRLGGMNFRFGEDFEAETTRKFRNRFDNTSPRGNRRSRAATGVKRNIWKNFFRKDAEDMPDELDMVMAQLYEIEDTKNPTPEDLTNYQNLLTRYYEIVSFNAEQKTARVRTMSGKPVSETLRKLKQDKNLSAKDARTRKEIKAEGELEYEGNCSWCKKPSVKVREVEYGGGGSICPNCHHSYRKLGYNPHKPPHPFKKGAENMEVFEAVSSNHDTYMKILSQVIKNYDSSSASKDAQLINRYGLTTMKRFMKWAERVGYSTYYCFTDVARDWLEGDEISSDDMKNLKALLRNLTDEKAKYQLATIIATENSDLARIYEWTTDSQHKDVISLDKWDEDQFVIDFLATEEEADSYYSQERLTLGSKNVSMILNLGDYEDEDDEATFFDELSPKSGKIPRNLPNTASLLDYLETNAEQFENMLYHNDGLRNFKILRDFYGWSFAIHPALKYIYEEDDEIYIEWQLKRAIPAKKRQQIKLDAQKQIRELRAKLLS